MAQTIVRAPEGRERKQESYGRDPTKRISRIIGILFIIATVTAALSGVVWGSILDDPLANAAVNENRLITGALLDLAAAGAVIGIAAMAYPILRRDRQGLAVSYVAARVVEGTILVLGVLTVLGTLTLSQEYTLVSAAAGSGFQALALLLPGIYDWTHVLGPVLAFGLGAILFYYMLYRATLTPRWLSIWGLFGAALIVAMGVMAMFGFDPWSTAAIIMFLPIAMNEMVLAAWLIVKGFNQPTAIPARSD